MGTKLDVVVFVAGGADAVNQLTSGDVAGMSPIGSAGTAVGVAGSGAQAIGSIISAKPAAFAVANGVGLGGFVLSEVQLTIDLDQGKSINTGDLISIGIGIPLGIAVATGAIGA